MSTDNAKKTTNRGKVLTTLPRLLQRDISEKLTPRERKDLFAIKGLNNWNDLAILRQKAQNRDNWKNSVEVLAEKDLKQWRNRNEKRKTKQEQAKDKAKKRQTQPTIQEFFART